MRTIQRKGLLITLAIALALFVAYAFVFPTARAAEPSASAANPTTFYGNEVENGDFEDSDDNSNRIQEGSPQWAGVYYYVGGATLERSQETAYFGSYSLKAVIGPSTTLDGTTKSLAMRFGNKMLNQNTNFTTGTYLVRMFVKGTANTVLTVAITGVTNGTWARATVSDTVTLTSAEWQEVWLPLDYVCPEAGTAAVDFEICSSTADPVYLDGISVFRMYDVTVTAPDAGTDANKLTVKDASGADITSKVVIESTGTDEFLIKGLYSRCVIVYNGVESETTGGAVGFVPYDVSIKLVDKNDLEVRGEYISLQPVEGNIDFVYDEATASYKAENIMGSYELAISAPYYYTEYVTLSDANASNDFTVVMQAKDYDSADPSYVDGNLLAGSSFEDADMVGQFWPGMWSAGTISDRAAFGDGALSAVVGPTDPSAATTGTSLKYRFGDKAEGWATQGNYTLASGTYRLRGFVRASENTTLTASISSTISAESISAQKSVTLEPGWNKIDITFEYTKPDGVAANDLILTADKGSTLYFDAFALFACFDATVTLPADGNYSDVKVYDLDDVAMDVTVENGTVSGLYGNAFIRYNGETIVVSAAENTADFANYTPDYIDPASVTGGFIDEGDFENITQDDFWYAAQANGKWGIYGASSVEPSSAFAKSGNKSIRFSTHQDWERVAYIVTNTVAPDIDFHVEGWLRRDEKPVVAVPELVIAAADAAGNPVYPDGTLCEVPLYDNNWHKFSVDFRYSLNTETSELTLWLNDDEPVVVTGVASISQIEFGVKLIADFSNCAADATDKIRDCGGSAYLDAVVGYATWDASFAVNDASGNAVTDAQFDKLVDGFGNTKTASYDAESGKYIVEDVQGGLTVKVAGGEGVNYVETVLNYNNNDLTLAPEYLLTVRLADADGNPLTGATIRIRSGSETLGIMTEGENGVYTMTVSGEVKVMISLDGYRFNTTYDAGPQNATLDIVGEKRETGGGNEDPDPGTDSGNESGGGCSGSVIGGWCGIVGGLVMLAAGVAVLCKKRNESR